MALVVIAVLTLMCVGIYKLRRNAILEDEKLFKKELEERIK